MREFFNMGGYGGYIWPAYAISAAVLIALSAAIWRRARSLSRRIEDANRKSAEPAGD